MHTLRCVCRSIVSAMTLNRSICPNVDSLEQVLRSILSTVVLCLIMCYEFYILLEFKMSMGL